MSNEINVETADLTDKQLVTLLKNHGIGRRSVMKLIGGGAAVATLGSSVAARPGSAGIHDVYGAPYEASESVPKGIADHVVGLHIHPGETHPGFPGLPPSDGGPVEFNFDPVGVHITTNDVVDFNIHSGLHTVTAIHSKFGEPPIFDFPDRVPTANGFTSPVMNVGDSWLYRFTEPGVYDIMCLPHYDLGMVVRVVVTDRNPNAPTPTDAYDDTLLPPLVEVVFDTPELTPENIINEGTVAWDDLSLISTSPP